MLKLRKPVYILTILAILAVPFWFLLASYGTKAGWWAPNHGMNAMSREQTKTIGYVAMGFGVLTLLIAAIPKPRKIIGMILGVFAIAFPVVTQSQAAKYEAARMNTAGIYDVASTRVNAPIFSDFIMNQRAESGQRGNPVDDYGTKETRRGELVADVASEAYPDIKTLTLNESKDQAFDRALRAVNSLGWDVATTDKAAGIIEATDSTPWYGYKDDVAIWIAANGDQSRLDIRSVSRVGGRDFGKNAKRIRAFMDKMGQ